MLQRSKILLGGVLSVGLSAFAALPAFAICASGNDMIFQCATAPDGTEQITVCKDGDTAFLSRHTRATGEMYFDIPLGMDPERDFLVEELDEDTGLSIQMGFWDADRDTAHILQFRAGWDSDADDYSPDGMEMWLQTPDWQQEVEQTLCKGNTVLFDPEPLFALTVDRGPLGHFYSVENILPEPSLIGRFRVAAPEGGIPCLRQQHPKRCHPALDAALRRDRGCRHRQDRRVQRGGAASGGCLGLHDWPERAVSALPRPVFDGLGGNSLSGRDTLTLCQGCMATRWGGCIVLRRACWSGLAASAAILSEV